MDEKYMPQEIEGKWQQNGLITKPLKLNWTVKNRILCIRNVSISVGKFTHGSCP